MLIYIIDFIVLFIIANFCYISLYYFGKGINKKSKVKNKKILDKEIVDVRVFYKLYNIDEKKIGYSKIRKIIIPISSFNLSLTIILSVNLFDSFILRILLGIFILCSTTILFYRILGYYCKKKGYVKNV